MPNDFCCFHPNDVAYVDGLVAVVMSISAKQVVELEL